MSSTTYKTTHRLLSREDFKKEVFSRDKGLCVVCKGHPAADAHHIIDRSLWDDGGYYVDNGVSVCEKCHWDAEKTVVSCDDLREKAGIKVALYPEHFYLDEKYDHWGNIVLPNGTRIKGELFGKPEVKKILEEAGVLSDFLKYVKFPRIYHVPWSPNLQNDDRRHENIDFFNGKKVVVTAKMDGENTSLYNHYIHARSVDSKHHPSRDWVKAMHASIHYDIPMDWRVCGENMYAEHSIHYNDLESYFLVFSVWNENNVCLNWDETVKWSTLLGLKTVPVICSLTWERTDKTKPYLDFLFRKFQESSKDPVEGYVIRIADEINFKDFRKSYAKYVRKGHVQTDEFWMTKPVVPNGLKSK